MVEVGRKCEAFLTRTVRHVPVNDVQADEIWGFVGCKERTKQRNGYGEEVGDAWCFVAIERDTKLILAWHLDKRTTDATVMFSADLRDATDGRLPVVPERRPRRVRPRDRLRPTGEDLRHDG
ncbi:hypothetical protein [Limnoglobus roseus]|uniref:Transposase n=1 Tax=Limnoglobus roseus TaxID=2598579 RepID=A0A5C1AH79_9BACT|nr:hypothetical protein [Limnoglobus roseus]QEL17517.1 hypothetical protein PX52LOC_04507 [Limnoglobus roseus]